MTDHRPLARPNDVVVRQGLPLARTPMFGRAEEIAEVGGLLADGRLVTITGQGGIGKTRVAIEVARAQSRRVIFVPLADVDRSGVAGAIFRAAAGGAPTTVSGLLAGPLVSGADTVARVWAGLADEVAGDRLLLVLDTFEHVTGAAGLVNEIRSALPDLAILVTSRCRLGLSDEAVVPLVGLPVDVGGPGERMFAEHSRRVGGDRHPRTETQQLAALEICRVLGGVPLAIELAAARTALMTPAALLAQFRSPNRGRVLGLLSRGPIDLPSRQLSMRSTLSWSYQLLEGAQQTLFRRLGVFPGSFTLDAAEQVCSGSQSEDGWLAPDTLLNSIAELVDLHLVEPLTPGPDRFPEQARFELHDAPRAFALELLEMSGEAGAVRGRLHEWCLEFAGRAERGLASTDEQSWLDIIEDELPALRQTLTHRGRAAGTAADTHGLRERGQRDRWGHPGGRHRRLLGRARTAGRGDSVVADLSGDRPGRRRALPAAPRDRRCLGQPTGPADRGSGEYQRRPHRQGNRVGSALLTCVVVAVDRSSDLRPGCAR